eukprot:2642412-Rhodomonas_salina.2
MRYAESGTEAAVCGTRWEVVLTSERRRVCCYGMLDLVARYAPTKCSYARTKSEYAAMQCEYAACPSTWA